MPEAPAVTPAVAMRERLCQEACRLLLEDERVAVVLSDISLPYFDEGFARAPDRIINVGIMEQTMIGVAAGLAMEGFHPIVHTIAPFLVERPFEQLKIDFGYQGLGGTFIGTGGSFDYAVEGTTHHSPADVALLSTIPGFEVLTPGTAEEAAMLLREKYDNGRPTYLRSSVQQNADSHTVQFDRIEVLWRRPGHPTILAVGPMLGVVEDALAGLDATLLYATTVTPLDAETLSREAGDHVIVVEPFLEGTLAPAVVAAVGAHPVRITEIGVPRVNLRGYGTREDLERVAGLDVAGVRARLQAAFA